MCGFANLWELSTSETGATLSHEVIMHSTFLTRILPPNPPVGTFALQPCYYMVGLPEHDKPRIIPFTNILDAQAIVNQLAGCNTYIAPALYKDSTFGRKAVNVKEIKCLWLDIDVGKEHNSYPTLEAATTALRAFITNTGCKPTILVHSGMGIQAYWTFTRPVAADAWKQFAHIFALFVGQQGLIADPVCTEDAARILRMPGTLHLKSGNMAQVVADSGKDYDPKELLALIGKQLSPDTVIAPMQTQFSVNAMQRAAQATSLVQAPRAKAEPIAKNCQCVANAGLRSEPEWFAMLGVMRSCVDGLEWAHKLSAMDTVRYDYNATEKKFYHAQENSPARCDRFASLNPAICGACPYYGKITSPIQLGLPSAITPPEAKTPPAPQSGDHLVIPNRFDYPLETIENGTFSITEEGILQAITKASETGEWITVEENLSTSRLYYTHSVVNHDGDAPRRVHWFLVQHRNGRSEEVPFVIQNDMTLANIMRWFQEANIYPIDPTTPPQVFMAFMTAYLQRVVEGNSELPTFKKFGWEEMYDPTLQERVPGFVVGPGIITETGLHEVNHDGVAARIAREELGHRGTLENWKAAINMYKTLDQKEAQLAILFSLAAPFMKYCPGIASNAIFSLWSNRSAKGKTNVIQACASVWGSDEKQLTQRHSSQVLRMRKLSTMRNLPVYLDELTDVPDADMYSLAYTLTEGREKQKLRSNGADMVETGDWKTVTFITANKSFKAAAASAAGDSDASLVRVMEIECNFKDYSNVPQVQAYINNCIEVRKNNYGVAGPEFVYQMLKRPDRLRTLNSQIAAWVSDNGFTSRERYMSAPLGLAMIMGRYAVEFDIVDFDMDALEKYVLEKFLPHNRARTNRLTAKHDEVLQQYLMERQLSTLIVEAHDRPTDMPPAPRNAPDRYIYRLPQREMYVRVERQEKHLYIVMADLQRWCSMRKQSVDVLIDSLHMLGIYTEQVKETISRGLTYDMLPAVPCLKLDINAVGDKLGYLNEKSAASG